MTRAKYWVVWSEDLDQWQFKKTGSTSDTKSFSKKEEAINYAVFIANRNQPSQLFIKKKDGEIQDERTYGDDPYPPKG
ncbi:DUF2188 domain-containing protein [Vibrio splendidus]|uniref:DUF2188 domain-containing protein n=1 Tax=Vibrio splendidus TaxID=29497 RepID=UPI00352EBF73